MMLQQMPIKQYETSVKCTQYETSVLFVSHACL